MSIVTPPSKQNELDPSITDSARYSVSTYRINKVKELETANKELNLKLQEVQQVCFQLKNELRILREENLKLTACKQVQFISDHSENNEQQPVFETDEEELAKETEWIRQKNKRSKKRKAESSPELISNDKSLPKKPIPTIRPPPAITVNDINEYSQVDLLIKSNTSGGALVKVLSNNTFKINVKNSDDYRSITKTLNEKKIPWHTYEDKQARPIRVIAKNLHHSCTPVDIVEDLIQQGLKAISAINKLKSRTKEPMDMFLLSFDPTEDIKKIYSIKNILNLIVKIEPVKQSKLVVQCKNCQSFGHTKNFCSRPPRCVKCAGKHPTSECTKPPTVHAKCCNCGKDHPASYRGCFVAKELQKIRKKNVRSDKQKDQPKIYPADNLLGSTGTQRKRPEPVVRQSAFPHNNATHASTTNPKKSYASISTVKSTPIVQSNSNILSQILSKLENQEQFYKTLEQRLDSLEQNVNTIFCVSQ